MLVPAGPDPRVEPAVAGHINRGGDLGVEGGVAEAVAAHHLSHLHPLCIPREGGGDGPTLEGGLQLGGRDGMEVVEDPHGVPPLLRFRRPRRPGHGLVLPDRIRDLGQVHAPTLRDEEPKFDRHILLPFFVSPA